MRFPLADWIDSHTGLRHDLAQSGMIGSIARPRVTARELRSATPEALRAALARRLRVAEARVSLTHGATEANAWVLWFLARGRGGPRNSCRVAYPEYPPLFDAAQAAGFRLTRVPGPVELAVVSQPRNPEGDVWPVERLLAWATDAHHLLIDETFREFGHLRSFASLPRPGVWVTGSFTKYYAGDDLRIGYVVAPTAHAREFARFVGLVSDKVAPVSLAGALSALTHHAVIARRIDRFLEPNRHALVRAFPGATAPVAPVWFDRVGPAAGRLTRRLLKASVLVCPGKYFGEPNGVRLCLTRPTFPSDLEAYLAVRARFVPRGAASGGRTAASPARRPPAGSVRARDGRA